MDDAFEDPLEDVELPTETSGDKSKADEPAQLYHPDRHNNDVYDDIVNYLVEGFFGLLVKPMDNISVELLFCLKIGRSSVKRSILAGS